MFANLSKHFQNIVQSISGNSSITEENIKDTARDIRIALLEADVALPVVKELIAKIQTQALGQEVLASITPGQAFVKILHDNLIEYMGENSQGINLQTQAPAIILLMGLQGAGKTTTAAKLAYWLHKQQKKSVLLVSTDIYRPAAIEQLKILAESAHAQFYPSSNTEQPVAITKQAIQYAKSKLIDVVIVDTAGRLHIDDNLMQELKDIHAATQSIETLLVVDSMTGQDAVQVAQKFSDELPITGVILSKVDGDSRGGAALSVRHVTGQPIKFMGGGERVDNLELFYPDRVVSRILGMGDIVSLVEEVKQQFDSNKAADLTKKIQQGKSFTLDDFREYIKTINKMGGMINVVSKLPINLPPNLKNQLHDNMLKRNLAIIDSMTRKERRLPGLIKGSHKKRIASGSGTSVQAINQLLAQFANIQKVLKKAKGKGGMMKMLRNLQTQIPPGGMY